MMNYASYKYANYAGRVLCYECVEKGLKSGKNKFPNFFILWFNVERNEGSCWTTFQAYSGGNCNLAQVSAISTRHSIQLSKLTQFNTLKVSEKYDSYINKKCNVT